MHNHPEPDPTSADAISAAARQVANTLSAAAIVTYTTSGSTTLRAARGGRCTDYRLDAEPSDGRRLAVVERPQHLRENDAIDFEDMTSKAGQHVFYGQVCTGGRTYHYHRRCPVPYPRRHKPHSDCPGRRLVARERKPSSLILPPGIIRAAAGVPLTTPPKPSALHSILPCALNGRRSPHSCAADQPTARWTMVASSVSPERADTITPKFAFVPCWHGLPSSKYLLDSVYRATRYAPHAAASSTRRAFVTR